MQKTRKKVSRSIDSLLTKRRLVNGLNFDYQ